MDEAALRMHDRQRQGAIASTCTGAVKLRDRRAPGATATMTLSRHGSSGDRSMQMRRLGRSALDIAPLAFGANVFGWTAGEATAFDLLDAFVAAGGSLIDTADVYPRWAEGCDGTESETIIGRWLKRSGQRERVVIATKVGKSVHRNGLSAANIRAAVEDSLKRLQTDVIDLYLSHRFDDEVPQEETLDAYARLIEAGKVRAIGASNFTADQLQAALRISAEHGLPRYESLQPHYNLVERADYERTLEPLIHREQIGVIPYYALASGFLTGKYRSMDDVGQRARGSAAAQYLDARGLGVLAALDEVAARHRASPAQVSLAWLMARPGITAPIASATSVAQLRELMAATELSLSADDIETLNRASA
jgi:aryl-alcohol dehydrogenase-like predicted oxidoreductase